MRPTGASAQLVTVGQAQEAMRERGAPGSRLPSVVQQGRNWPPRVAQVEVRGGNVGSFRTYRCL
jgi:hypothetical protein